MKRSLVLSLAIAILLLAAFVLVVPGVVGMVVERQYTAMLDQFSRDRIVKVNVVAYERHWFTADVIIVVSFNPHELFKIPEGIVDDQPVSFRMTQRIHHGLFLPVSPNFGLAFIDSKLEPGIGSVKADSVITLGGTFVSVLSAKNLQYSSRSMSFDAKDVDFSLSTAYGLKTMKGRLRLSDLLFKSNGIVQKINNLNTDFDLVRGEGGLLLGSRSGTASAIKWQLPDPLVQVGLKNVKVSSTSDVAHKKVSTNVAFWVDDLGVDETYYGPQEVRLSVSGIDLPVYLLLRKELSTIAGTDVLFSGDDKSSKLMFLLLSKGLNVDLEKFSVSTAWGSAQANAAVYFTPLASPSSSMDENMSFDAHVQLPSMLLVKLMGLFVPQDKVREQIEAWVKADFITPVQNGFMVDVSYQDRQFYLNRHLFESEKFWLSW